MGGGQEKKKKVLGIEWNIFFAGLTSLLTDTTTKMIYAIMPLFLISIGASKIEVSLIEGIAESTASVLKALSGWWSDKIGKNKPFMLVGYANALSKCLRGGREKFIEEARCIRMNGKIFF